VVGNLAPRKSEGLVEVEVFVFLKHCLFLLFEDIFDVSSFHSLYPIDGLDNKNRERIIETGPSQLYVIWCDHNLEIKGRATCHVGKLS